MNFLKFNPSLFKHLIVLFAVVATSQISIAENCQTSKNNTASNSKNLHLAEGNCSNEFINNKGRAVAHLNKIFKKYETKIAVSNINRLRNKNDNLNLTIDLGTHGIFELLLNSNDLLSEKFIQKIRNQANKKDASIPLTYNGKIVDRPQSKVALTINENFMSGFVEYNNTTIYFEPLSNFYTNAKPDELIIYNKSDVLAKKIGCSHNHQPQSLKVAEESKNFKKSATTCNNYTVEIVLAADYGMYSKYGSVTAVRNQITSVLNAAQAHYDNEFNDPITFKVVDDYIASPQLKDLWPDEANADKLLDKFANSDFTTKIYDLASLWVKRRIWTIEDGDTIDLTGLAYRSGICRNTQKYNLISENGSTADYLRTAFAHEVGHNFSAVHDNDDTKFIMTQGVLSSEWSAESLNKINDFYPTTNCLCSTKFVDLAALSTCTQFSVGGITYKSMKVENIGNTASVATKVGLFLSPDKGIDSGDYLVKTTTLAALEAGDSRGVQIALNFNNVDLPCGDYYHGFVVDFENEVDEGSENNNFSCFGTTKIGDCPGKADLTIENCSAVTIAGNVITSGNITLKNIGDETAPETFLGYYLSTNPTIDASDYLVAQSRFPKLEGGASFSRLISRDISEVTNNIPAGTYYFGVLADRNNALAEANESNNSCYDGNPRFTVTYGCKDVNAHNYNPTATFRNDELCLNCNDGIKNGDEEKVDCGGSCPKTCPDAVCKQTDKVALIALYNSTNGANWANPWNLSEPVENWEGVLLDNEGCVIALNFFNNNMKGSLPIEIGQLSKLKWLQLRYNGLSGNIPASIGNLSNLEILSLSTNKVTGSIPASLSKLSKLKNLNLASNALSGSIPASLANLSKLETLLLSTNALTGKIPSQLGNLESLKELKLYSNALTGEIPAQLGNLSKLQKLQLASNKLTGKIPISLGNLNNLKELDLYLNQLGGNIPIELSGLENLKELNLMNNKLAGSIPKQFGKLKKLEELNLSSNQLTGTIPVEFADLSNLKYIGIYINDLSGCFDDELLSLCGVRQDINYGNNFEISWDAFCTSNGAVCNGTGGKIKSNTNLKSRNYPNPFKINTTIEFDLPTESNVSIKVFNTAGKQLSVLIDEAKFPEGTNKIEFNGSKYPSGVYYYSIESNDYISTQKMILVQ